MISDNENSLEASGDAFDVARYITAKRLKAGLLTVIDATNVQEAGRKDWVRLAGNITYCQQSLYSIFRRKFLPRAMQREPIVTW